MTHHTEAERADCPACGGKPFIRRSHDADGMRWSHVECKGCGLRTRGKWVASSSDECPIFFQEVWEEWPRRAPAAPVPQGWKLVPSESTEEMARAFRADDAPHYFVMTTMRCNDFAERYRAAISAAPQPPEAAQSNSAEFEGIKPDAFQTEGGCPVSNAETVAIAALEKVLRAIQRHLPPERIGERETIAEIISIVDPWPLGNLPAPWKDHRTAALVNELRDCAAKYGQTQQLRERIAYIVAPLCAQLKAAEQAAVNQQLTTETAPVQLPENLREGEPYDNPAFEALARALGVWGTAQSAVCAQFWIAAKEQST